MYFGPICGGVVGVGLILGVLRGWMVESNQGIVDVAWHEKVDFTLSVIPIEGEAKVFPAGPILRNFVVGLECRNEVVGVFFTNVFYAKVIHDK